MARMKSDEVTIVAALPLKPPEETSELQPAHLIVLSGTNVGQVFELSKRKIVIGREEGVDIQIMDAGISRQHATIFRDHGGTFVLEDAGSRNGTFANNKKVEKTYKLLDGDRVQLGVMTILKFTYSNAPEANYAQVMYEAALRDGLTGVFNRRYFDDRLKSEFAFASRHDTTLALLLMDLDFFKKINDTYGHPAGDAVLRDFSKLVCKICRTEDVLSRYGGEEFCLLCRDTELMKASVLGERIRHAISAHFFTAGSHQVKITVSIGIAGLPDPAITTPEALVLAADEALYQAKQRGRNCVVAHHQP
jgi:two-component system, cell cycle response regulator